MSRKFNLTAKIQQIQFLNGSSFRVTDSSAPITVTFHGGDRIQKVDLEKGMGFSPDGGFTEVRFDSEITQTIEVEATLGNVQDNRISGTVDVNIKPLTGIQSRRETLTATVRKVIAQQDASRNTILIKNVGLNEAHIGGVDVETAGFELAVNESLPIDRAAAAEIYAVSASGTDLHIFEEFDELQAVSIPADILTTEIGGSILTESGEYLTA